jgi:hypothetical protein
VEAVIGGLVLNKGRTMKIEKAIEVLQQLHKTTGDGATVKVFKDNDTPRNPVTGMNIEHELGSPVVLIHVLHKDV